MPTLAQIGALVKASAPDDSAYAAADPVALGRLWMQKYGGKLPPAPLADQMLPAHESTATTAVSGHPTLDAIAGAAPTVLGIGGALAGGWPGAAGGGMAGAGIQQLEQLATGSPDAAKSVPALIERMRQAGGSQAIGALAGEAATPVLAAGSRAAMAGAMRVTPKFVQDFPGAVSQAVKDRILPGTLGRLTGAPGKAGRLWRQAVNVEEGIGQAASDPANPAPWMRTADRLASKALGEAQDFRYQTGRPPLTPAEEQDIVDQVQKFGEGVIGRRTFGQVPSRAGQFTANEVRAIKQFADGTVRSLRNAERAGTAVGGAAQSSIERQIGDQGRDELRQIPGMEPAMRLTQARIGIRQALRPSGTVSGSGAPARIAYHGGALVAGGALGAAGGGEGWHRRALEGALLAQLALSPSALGAGSLAMGSPIAQLIARALAQSGTAAMVPAH